MLLAVDIGNSSIKFGVFDGETLHSKFSIPTKRDISVDELESTIGEKILSPIAKAIICSVVPEIDEIVRKVLHNKFNIEAFFVTSDVDLGFEIKYFDQSSLGTDRLVNAFAAAEKYGTPCIVCSFGTATTIDAVTEKEFLGSIIAPGIQMMADALHHFTSKLPAVDVRWEGWVSPPSTEDCIRAGATYSQMGLVEVVVRDIRKDIGDAKVVATGGFASMIAENTTVIDVVDENLLLDGLRMLYSRM